MPGFLIEALYNFKNNGDLTEDGYNIAINVLDILNVRKLSIKGLIIYRDHDDSLNKTTIELKLVNSTLYVDILLDNTVEIYTVTSKSTMCKDFTNNRLNDMYLYFISLL